MATFTEFSNQSFSNGKKKKKQAQYEESEMNYSQILLSLQSILLILTPK